MSDVMKEKKSTLSQKTYEEIRNLIVLGKLTQKERISETKLSKELNISRTPIREAIRMLEQDGLISRDSMGAYVNTLSKEEAIDIYKVRIELEVFAVRLAMENALPEELEQLRNIIREIDLLRSEEADLLKIISVNSEFHSHLDTMSHNFYLKYTLEDIRTRLCLLRANSLAASKRSPQLLQEHLDVSNAILSGNVDTAVEKMKIHSEKAAKFAISNLFI